MTATLRPFVFTTAILLSLVVGGMSPATVHALGLSPPTVEIDSLLRGTTQERSVTLYRAPDDVGDVYIHVEPDIKAIDFFVLESTDLVMLDGQTELTYPFKVTSGDAANGEYELKLRFLKTKDPTKVGTGAAVSVVTGVTAQVLVTVGGEEHLEYALRSVFGSDTEEGMDVPVRYSIDNTGNVDWQPSKIVYAFINDAGEVVSTSEIFGSEVPVVKAGKTEQQFDVRVPAELVRGRYTVQLVFWNGADEAGTLVSPYPFEVHVLGTLAQAGTLKGMSMNKVSYRPDEQAKVSAIFQNEGQVRLKAKFVLEITREGEIIDLLKSDEFDVGLGEEFVFSQFFKAGEVGTYLASGYIEYGNRNTPSKEFSFEVLSPPTEQSIAASTIDSTLSRLDSVLGLGIFTVVLIVCLALIMLWRRHRMSRPSQETPLVSFIDSTPTSQPDVLSAAASASPSFPPTPVAPNQVPAPVSVSVPPQVPPTAQQEDSLNPSSSTVKSSRPESL